MKLHGKHFRAPHDQSVNLKNWPTRIEPVYASKEDYRALLDEHVTALSDLQLKLYASQRFAVLVIFQATDAAGKDSAIRHVMSGVNPQGCQVHSFGAPSTEERAHDFLWRATRVLPARGMIGIFNRSYYEEVLVVRVHPALLAAQGLPETLVGDPAIWDGRLASISDYERHLTASGTRIVKIFLHVSRSEQRDRLIARIDDPTKTWKANPGDAEERKYWKTYRKTYEQAISATSTRDAPWFIVPADDQLTARLCVSQILLETLKDLNLTMPSLSPERLRELRQMRKALLTD